VKFDADEVRAIVERLVTDVGLPADVSIVVEVDERTPTGSIELRGLDPVHCFAESGALEHPQHNRRLNPDGTREAIGRLLFEASDRFDPKFGAPPLGDDITLGVRVAWDTYIVGRLVRLGGREQRARRLYHYRSRHGFHDGADAGFDRLWNAERLTFAEITAISAGSIDADRTTRGHARS
jgi:hypothetical protein